PVSSAWRATLIGLIASNPASANSWRTSSCNWSSLVSIGVANSIASPLRFPTADRAKRARRSWSASAQGLRGLADGFSQHLQEFVRRSDGQLQRLQPFLQLGRVRCGFSKPAPEVLDEYGCLPQRLFLFRQALFQSLHSWRGAVTQPPAEALTRSHRGVRRRCGAFSSG